MDDVHDVFAGERLEVELVGGGIVGGDGFGVVVHDDGLKAELPDRPHGVDSRIVELDTLPDADGAGAEDNDLFSLRDDRLVFLGVGGIEIGHIAVKFTGAGIDHFIDREDLRAAAQGIDPILRPVPELGDIGIGESEPLGLAQVRQGGNILLQLTLKIDDLPDLIEEEHVDLRDIADPGLVDAEPHQLRDGIEAVIGAVFDIVQELIDCHMRGVEFLKVEVVFPLLE